MKSEMIYPPEIKELIEVYQHFLSEIVGNVIAQYEPIDYSDSVKIAAIYRRVDEASQPILTELVRLRSFGTPVIYLSAEETDELEIDGDTG